MKAANRIHLINKDERGVTLVELIVSMGIMMLVIIMIYSFFILSDSLSRINSEKADAQAQTRLIFQGLQKEIETASLVLIGNTDDPKKTIQDNSADYAFYVEGGKLKRMAKDGTVTIPFGSLPLDFLSVAYEKDSEKIVKVKIRTNDISSEYLVYAPNTGSSSLKEFGETFPRYALIIANAKI